VVNVMIFDALTLWKSGSETEMAALLEAQLSLHAVTSKIRWRVCHVISRQAMAANWRLRKHQSRSPFGRILVHRRPLRVRQSHCFISSLDSIALRPEKSGSTAAKWRTRSRRILLFQDWEKTFSWLTARENVEFGLRKRRKHERAA